MMEIILIATFSIICFFIINKISKYVKLEKQILFLILGIIIGLILKKTGYESLNNVFPKISQYNMTALMFMFFCAGFTINVGLLKKSGSLTAKMFSIPTYFETIIMSVFIFSIIKFIPSVGYKLGFLEALIIAAIFSTSSPANIIPICSSMISEGYTDKNNIPSTIILASIVDGFVTFPVVFASIFILVMQNSGADISLKKILIIILGSIFAIAIALILGIIIGRLIVTIASFPFKKLSVDKQAKYKNYLVILLAFALSIGITALLKNIDSLKTAISIFGILIMCGIGASINYFDKTGVNDIIRNDGNKLFALFGMPVIFAYVGSGIDLHSLFNIKQLLFFATITFVAVYLKGLAAKFVLRDKKYTKGERKFASLCYIPKGMSLINFTVLFGVILSKDSPFIIFTTMLGTISVILTMSIGLPLISRSKGKHLKKYS